MAELAAAEALVEASVALALAVVADADAALAELDALAALVLALLAEPQAGPAGFFDCFHGGNLACAWGK